jgi:hypothetical protein
MSADKKILLIVETIEGESVEIQINDENKVEKLVREAMVLLNIDPGAASYELRYENKNLEFDKKIKELGLKSGSVVLLQRVPVVG